MQAILMLFDIKPITAVINTKKEVYWWETAVKEILKSAIFLKKIIDTYNEEKIKNLPNRIIKRVTKFLEEPDLADEKVKRAS